MYTKILQIMRLTTVLLIATIMQVSASGLAQNITLQGRGMALKEAFTEIRRQSGFDIVWQPDKVDGNSKINISVRDIPLQEALNRLLESRKLSYTIKNKTIFISPQTPTFLDRLAERWAAIDVRGTVVDDQGIPLVGATVRVKGTNKSTQTNANGVFSIIDVAEDATLVITYLGYKTKEVSVSEKIDKISLSPTQDVLEETVIIGYGQTTKRLNTGSVSTVTAQDIATQPVSNPLAVLGGRMPGVQVIQETGVPGGSFSVKIRGQNSLRTAATNNANNPLYIVDGVPFSSTMISSSAISNNITGANSSPLNSISPSDIERIDVLKDADATSIYGSRGANGVVLITTKRGLAGRLKVDVNGYFGFGDIDKRLNLLNTKQYLEVRREAFSNDGTNPGNADYDLNGKWDQNAYTDWQEVLIGGTAPISNLQANISGGTSQTTYLLGLTGNKEGTVFPGNFYNRRYSGKLAVSHKDLSSRFKFDANINYSTSLNNLFNNSLSAFINLPPNTPSIYTTEGKLNWAEGFSNPLAQVEKKYVSDIQNFQVNGLLNYNLFRGFDIKSTIGYSSMQMDEIQANPLTSFNPANNPTAANRVSNFNYANLNTWIVEPQLHYNTNLFNGVLTALLGTTFQKDVKKNHNLTASGFANDLLLENIGSATSVVVSNSGLTNYKYNALFGRINYLLNHKYIFNFTTRRDGSSRFGPGRQFANFYSGGLAWIFSEEPWFKKIIPSITFGKLKTSYGTTGNDVIGDYQFLETWSSTTYAYAGENGIAPTRLLNPDFAWEVNKKFDSSLELGLLNNKILFSASYYRNQSSNQLVGYALAPSVGFTSVQSNLNALIRNTGTEFTLSFDGGTSNALMWNSSVNLSIPKNKLVSYPGLAGSSYANTYSIGKSLNLEKAYRFLGIDPNSGIYMFEDQNGNSTLTSPIDLVDDKDLGQKYYGGFQNSLTYRNWNIDVFFQYVRQTAKDYTLQFAAPGRMFNYPDIVLNRWSNSQDTYRVQKYTASSGSAAGVAFTNYRSSTGSIADASFIRLKNISLSYTIPPRLSGILKIQNCRFFIQGQNVLTISKYQGLDPETTNVLPPLRVFTAGFSLTL